MQMLNGDWATGRPREEQTHRHLRIQEKIFSTAWSASKTCATVALSLIKSLRRKRKNFSTSSSAVVNHLVNYSLVDNSAECCQRAVRKCGPGRVGDGFESSLLGFGRWKSMGGRSPPGWHLRAHRWVGVTLGLLAGIGVSWGLYRIPSKPPGGAGPHSYAFPAKRCSPRRAWRLQAHQPPKDHRLIRTVFPPQLRRAARLTAPHTPVARAWRAGLGHASARRCSDPAPDHAAQ
jgi:hypothetical protein